jgi:hypothetical protein
MHREIYLFYASVGLEVSGRPIEVVSRHTSYGPNLFLNLEHEERKIAQIPFTKWVQRKLIDVITREGHWVDSPIGVGPLPEKLPRVYVQYTHKQFYEGGVQMWHVTLRPVCDVRDEVFPRDRARGKVLQRMEGDGET